MFQGFEPVFDENSKILILGSFPSVKSRENGFYYGHPQNRFWKMLSQVFDEKFANDTESKKTLLKKHKIALYDVVAQSDLSGSADLSLEKSNRNLADISFLLPPHTSVTKILCNGKTAFKLLTQNNPSVTFEEEKAFFKNPNLDNFNEMACKENHSKTTAANLENFNLPVNEENKNSKLISSKEHKKAKLVSKKENKNSKNAQKPAKNAQIPIFCLPSTSSANPRFDPTAWQNALTK